MKHVSAEPLFRLLSADAVTVSRRLLGSELVLEKDGALLRGTIVETEAYDQTDAASHSYRGVTPRTEVMFGPPGKLYVYFTYGMHYCANVVTGPEGTGSAVLIRAVEPLEGEALMLERRSGRSGIQLTNGPAKWCQAFGIDTAWNKHDLEQPPLRLIMKEAVDDKDIVATTRIGIRESVELPWRFYIRGNPYVSKP